MTTTDPHTAPPAPAAAASTPGPAPAAPAAAQAAAPTVGPAAAQAAAPTVGPAAAPGPGSAASGQAPGVPGPGPDAPIPAPAAPTPTSGPAADPDPATGVPSPGSAASGPTAALRGPAGIVPGQASAASGLAAADRSPTLAVPGSAPDAPIPGPAAPAPTSGPVAGSGPASAGFSGRRGLAGAALCAVLGFVLIGGAGWAAWQDRRDAARPPSAEELYRRAGTLWHEAPVDTLFPPRLDTDGTGPGGADRAWTRIAVVPDAACPDALPADWQQALAGPGCTRVLRATYADVTRSTLVTVGLVFTPAEAGPEAVNGLRDRLPMPPGLGFAAEQRAAWTVSVRSDAPVVVYAVSAFADGRAVKRPLTAEEAMNPETEGAVARAGLGHAVRAVAGGVEKSLGARVAPPSPEPKR
ncbi:hypothetical protein [Streptomyces sp. NPDC002054]|uniref:hypothetical protein n=1 Tax=Streptomyces sp. NPDC002054 TaxID=3154663 RepID=UPI00331ED506